MTEIYLSLGLIYYLIQVGIVATTNKNFIIDPMVIFFAILVWPVMLVSDVASALQQFGKKK